MRPFAPLFLATSLALNLNLTPTLAESWSIQDLTSHFMGSNSGLPGGTWPPGTEFPNHLAFNLVVVDDDDGDDATTSSRTVGCAVTWDTTATITGQWLACAAESESEPAYALRLDPTTATGFSPATFVLSVRKQSGSGTAANDVLTASVTILDNTPSSPDSWLTCLGGPPLDGIRCKLDGVLSSRKAPIPLSIVESAAASTSAMATATAAV